MTRIFQTPCNSPPDSPLVPEYCSSYQKHQQQQQQRDKDGGHMSWLLLADHLLLTLGSCHVGWAPADRRAELSRHDFHSHGCQGNGEGPQDPDASSDLGKGDDLGLDEAEAQLTGTQASFCCSWCRNRHCYSGHRRLDSWGPPGHQSSCRSHPQSAC